MESPVSVSGQGSTPECLGAESGDEARDALVLCCDYVMVE